MYTDVYVDVLFLINFSMDAIALYLTARLCSVKYNILRVCISSSLGAIYSLISVFCRFIPLFEIVILVSVSVFMVCISFDLSSFFECVKTTVVFYIASSVIGGIISSLYTLLVGYIDIPDSVRGKKISVGLLLILSLVSIFLSVFLTRLHGSGNMPGKIDLTILVLNKELKCVGIVDSGNLLKEPLTNKPVIVIDAKKLTGILSRAYLDMAKDMDFSKTNALTQQEMSVFRVIPASSVCGQGYLLGVNTQRVCIGYKRKNKYCELERDAVLALSSGVGQECIVPASIL